MYDRHEFAAEPFISTSQAYSFLSFLLSFLPSFHSHFEALPEGFTE